MSSFDPDKRGQAELRVRRLSLSKPNLVPFDRLRERRLSLSKTIVPFDPDKPGQAKLTLRQAQGTVAEYFGRLNTTPVEAELSRGRHCSGI